MASRSSRNRRDGRVRSPDDSRTQDNRPRGRITMVEIKARGGLFLPPSAPLNGLLSTLVTLTLCLLTLTSLIPFGPHPVHAASSVNVITNPSFEDGLNGWGFENCEGVANATATLDNSRWTDGSQSAKIFTGQITPTGCFPGDFTGRNVGFTQFRQFLSGWTFNNLTNSPNGFSFSFYLEPYGYGPGEWHHFSRNLRADWENLGLNMTRSFALVQFEGLALNIGGNVESETFWLDDVRAY